MTETVLAPTPALLVAPRAVRLVNPRLTQLAEMALFDEPGVAPSLHVGDADANAKGVTPPNCWIPNIEVSK